ncbi:MAG: hypothetical protein GAK29_01415 [Acinetobacter bereziniae]|uniref:Phage protein n=1 Tax=Acinetobacter bereziniae TaxID=106648 RepID=A0A833TZE6_ACIBZ|nr:MAG: hypothetical protein GAK29_01415 [Acinetobacter bereziniae]
MQITHHTDNQIEKTNVPRFLQTMKALAPRSYEKAFHGMDEEVVIFAMGKAIQGLSKQQLQNGLDAMLEQGYCPDPIMFHKWCLGIKGIGEGVNPIHASYRAKNAALANIEAWLIDCTTKITNAEREAYNRCYGMFNDLKWNYSDKQKFHTYAAFKDFYDEVVKELVANGVSQSIWIEPPKIENKIKHVSKDYLKQYREDNPEYAKEADERDKRVKEMVEGGMSVGQAYMALLKEKK